MNKLTPTIYMLGVLAVFIVAWYYGPEDRLVNFAWALPGLLVGTFATLWSAMRRLESKVAKLEREIQTLKEVR